MLEEYPEVFDIKHYISIARLKKKPGYIVKYLVNNAGIGRMVTSQSAFQLRKYYVDNIRWILSLEEGLKESANERFTGRKSCNQQLRQLIK